jgi:hypothetical protein
MNTSSGQIRIEISSGVRPNHGIALQKFLQGGIIYVVSLLTPIKVSLRLVVEISITFPVDCLSRGLKFATYIPLRNAIAVLR